MAITPTDITFVVDGVDRTSYVQTVNVIKSGSIENVTITTRDIAAAGGGAWRPTLGDEYRLSAASNTVLLAGGTIDDVSEDVIMGKNGPAVTRLVLDGRGHEVIPSQIYVESYSLPAQTTYASYTDVYDRFLAPRGVVDVMPASTGGGDLPALEFADVYVSDILDTIQTLSGVPWRLQGDKWFTAATVGSWTGPALNTSNLLIRSASKSQSRTLQINRGYGSVSLANDVVWTETLVGDGTKFVFPLVVRPTANAFPTEVVDSSGTHTIGGAVWDIDVPHATLVRATPLTGNANVTFTVSGSTVLRRWMPSAEFANGAFRYDTVDGAVDLSGQTELQAASETLMAEVSRRSGPLTSFSAITTDLGYYPWMAVDVTMPHMAANGSYLVQETTTHIDAINRIAETQVTMLAGDALDPDLWTRQFRKRGGSGTGGAITASGGSGGGGGGTTTVPFRFPIAGSNDQNIRTAGAWQDAPEATPLVASAAMAALGTYTLRVYAHVRNANTSFTACLWSDDAGAAVATTASTNSTSWATLTATTTLTAGHTYRVKVMTVGGSDGVCGRSTLDAQ